MHQHPAPPSSKPSSVSPSDPLLSETACNLSYGSSSPLPPQNDTPSAPFLPSASPTSSCALLSATTRRHRRKGHILGVAAGLVQAIDVVLLHGVLSSASFSIFIPLFIIAVSFSLFSVLCIRIFKIPVRCTFSRRLVVLFFLRAILGGCLSAASLYSLQNVPAGVAVTIFSTAPSIASILSALLLKSGTSTREVIILTVNVIGVILVANPTATATANQPPITTRGLAAAMFNALCIAASFTVAKALGDGGPGTGQSVHPVFHTLAMGLGAFVVSPFLFCRNTMMAFSSTPSVVLLLVVAELLELASQLLMSYAVRLTEPGKLLLMRSVNVPAVCLLGFLSLGETLGATQLIGVGIVLSSIAYIAVVAT